MADLYEILGAISTVELVGGSQSRDVRIVTARTKAQGVVYSFRVVKGDFAPSHVNLIAHDLAGYLDKDAAVPGVVGLQLYQDVDGQGQFVPRATATVESTSGDSVEDVAIPYGDLFGDGFAKAVRAARANLDAIEAL